MIHKIRSNALLSGTFLMFVGSNIANFFGFVYQFAMGRLLAEQEFGELVAFLSLLGLLSSLYSFTGLIIIKYVAESEEDEKKKIFHWFTNKTTKFGFIIAGILLILTPVFAHFLHMSPTILLLLAPIFLVWLLSYVYRSVLQGVLMFFETVIVANVDLIVRLIVAIILVFAGLKTFGAIFASLVGSLLSFLLVKRYLRNFSLKAGIAYKPDKRFYDFGVAALIYTIAITSFFTTDVLLVKHFFDPVSAGLYGAVAVLGRTVLYATVPIATVMFPLVTKRHAEGGEYRRVFLASLGLNGLVAFCMSVLFAAVPGLLIAILFGQFAEASSLLFPYGIFMSFYTLSTLFAHYYLSQNKIKMVYVFLLFSIIQIIGILLFHSTLLEVIYVSAGVAIGMFITLLLYFLNEKPSRT